MAILSELREAVDAFAARSALDVERDELLTAVRELSGDDLIDLAARAYAAIHTAQCVATVAAAVIAERSTREQGHGGLAAVKGHKTARDLVQAIAGGTKADAARTVRLGESLLDGEPASDAGVGARPAVVTPWHDPLRRAMLSGGLTAAQHDAIYRGLGEPPAAESSAVDSVLLREAWTLAATQLIAEAAHLSVEELARRARQVRDALDPAGLEERFARRYEARSFVRWTDAEGGRHARIDFDDDGGELIEAIIAAALRPRRGGPRFVAEDERRAADDLVADPRTNDQLTYDLMIGVLRAGALADAADVFGARQPGVRMIVVKDAVGPRDPFGRLIAAGNVEDGGNAIPGSMIERAICESGTVQITVDSCGNPLDVGREQRLFSPRQRISWRRGMADAAGQGATCPRLTAKRIIATSGQPITGGPTSTGASCSAGTTT